jgi:hypothetical protein
MTKLFCTYVTYHATGKFYVGKGVTADVLSGKYRGSGTILVDYFKKYPKNEWITDIASLHEDEQAAYNQEARWIDEALIKDPDCLNINLGGKGGCRRKQSSGEIAKRAAAIRVAKASPEHRALMAQVSAEASARPEVQAKRKEASARMWSKPGGRDKMLDARKDSYNGGWKLKLSEKAKKCRRSSFAVEVDGIIYPRQVDACRALNLHRKLLRKLPTFKELT